jgi:hypothetical protein
MFDDNRYFWEYVSEDKIRSEMDKIKCMTRREAHDYLEERIKRTSVARRPWLLCWNIMYSTFKFQISLESHRGKIRFKEDFYLCGWRYDSASDRIYQVDSYALPPVEQESIISEPPLAESSSSDVAGTADYLKPNGRPPSSPEQYRIEKFRSQPELPTWPLRCPPSSSNSRGATIPPYLTYIAKANRLDMIPPSARVRVQSKERVTDFGSAFIDELFTTQAPPRTEETSGDDEK